MSENTITPAGLLSSYLKFFQNIWAFFQFYNRHRIAYFLSVGIRKPLIYLLSFAAICKAVRRCFNEDNFGKFWKTLKFLGFNHKLLALAG